MTTTKTAVKKSNRKTYAILLEWVIPAPSANGRYSIPTGTPMFQFQAINPANGQPWQALRNAPAADFETPLAATAAA